MPRTANPWAALVALCLGFFMILLDTTIVSIAIPSMITGLRADLNSVVWVTSVYLLTYAVPMLLSGRLGDRFGPKRMYLTGLVLFTAASLWCGLSGSITTLIVARAFQGIGAALMTPQTLAFITHLFPPARRGAAMGFWGAVAGIATISGPLLGGVLVDHLGWEWIFFVNLPVGVIALVAALVLVPDWQPKHAHSFDLPGILLSAAGLTLVVFGLQNGQHYDWGTVAGPITVPEIIGAGVLCLLVFVFWQRRNRKEPLMPLRLFGNRDFSAGTFVSITVGFAMTAIFIPLVIYLQGGLGLSPTEAALVTIPMCLTQGFVAPLAGKLSDRFDARYVLIAGLVALAGGLTLLSTQAEAGTSPWALVPALFLCGVGIGSLFPPMSTLTMGSVDRELTGSASGVYNTARQVGGVLGSAGVGVLLQARITSAITGSATSASLLLPAEDRAAFVGGLTEAAGSGSEFGPPPTGGKYAELGAGIILDALVSSAKSALLLPAVVLLAGVAAAFTMRRARGKVGARD
ncbi:DHA2 family efflux MFS transporter permease subunit [Amycolatopsis sp. 195334CR]|uniref:DHA2 family efflux MFS transporter permease subunit n=1 Tax=Amycolatopsis sp. 195334CR TaxID=2814588 RepID=UPI001A90B2B9|nr:DHA2 family efflux MFS transporter permease subunit [Amycolatopsis sp. 195334CR]MBN6036597.1 DHA2 family efflux MFS transporter permease subunit [Amycolatopsis sp. 195334CR]